jgi:predicted ATPase
MVKNIYIISGGPGTGKTSVIKELEKRGFKVFHEAARLIGSKDKRFIGKTVKGISAKEFQEAIFNLQKKRYSKIKSKDIIFSDRGFGDTLAYYNVNKIEFPKEKFEYAKKVRFPMVFILDFLNFYETDGLRVESKKEQEKIHQEIIKMYKKLGYNPIIVPFDSVENRVDFILEKIK